MKSKYIQVAAMCSLLMGGWGTQAYAHGYISSPQSRAYLCQQKENTNCGAVQYEPQSIEGDKGFPDKGPLDGNIASAGKPAFHELDEQTSTRWKKVKITQRDVSFKWDITAAHSTTSWRYFITRKDWDPSKPLSRSSFESKPFCQYNDNGALPGKSVTHKCTLPVGYSGYHVILATWDIANTGNAFYQVIDSSINY